MEANEYQQLAARTLIDRPDFTIADRDIMLIWNALGLAGETGELAKLMLDVNTRHHVATYQEQRAVILKEAGDCYWYVAAICTKIGQPMSDLFADRWLFVSTPSILALQLAGAMGDVVDYIKKGVLHQHGVDESALFELVKEYGRVLRSVCSSFLLDEKDDIWPANIEKLMRRYPAGFTSQDSIARVDATPVTENPCSKY